MMPVPRPAAILSMVVLLCAGTASVATLAWHGSFLDVSPAPAGRGARGRLEPIAP
jgi:hypothetical protein